MRAFAKDLQQTVHALRRRPGLVATVVLTLGLGVGVSTAVFSVVNGVLLRPLPYRDADRLVALFTQESRTGQERNASSPADYLEWTRESRSLEELTAASPWSPVLTGRGEPEAVSALKATPSLFELLRADAALGQVWAVRSQDDVVVLSDGLWRRRFGADPHIVGQALTLDGKPYVVAGVMPPGFRFPPFWMVGAEMWTPCDSRPRPKRIRRASCASLRACGREPAWRRQERASSRGPPARGNAPARPHRHPVQRRGAPGAGREPGAAPPSWPLLGAVAFVLLIAGANVTSLLMARGLGREREVVLRAALGAGRRRLLGLLLTETMSLSLLGGLLGLGLAGLGIAALRVLGPRDLPRLEEIRLDGRVLAFGLLLSLATGFLSGLAPALRGLRSDLTSALKGGERTTGSARHPLHDALVVVQFALAVVLLVGAGLLTKSFLRLLHPEPGFRTENLLTMTLVLSGSPFAEPARQPAFFERALDGARQVPGVIDVALVNHLPVAGDTWGLASRSRGSRPRTIRPRPRFASSRPGISRRWAFLSGAAVRSRPTTAPTRPESCWSTKPLRDTTGPGKKRRARGSVKAAPNRHSLGSPWSAWWETPASPA
jgi:predicted permease